jgi:hypothetical protein
VENIAAITPTVLDGWPLPSSTVEQTFHRMFEFLTDRWDRIPAQLVRSLQQIPCVPIGHAMVPVSRVFLRLAAPLAPWLFELPREYAIHDALFQKLGVRSLPDTAILQEIIQSIAAERRGCSLDPSELHAFIRVLE